MPKIHSDQFKIKLKRKWYGYETGDPLQSSSYTKIKPPIHSSSCTAFFLACNAKNLTCGMSTFYHWASLSAKAVKFEDDVIKP